MLLRSEEARTGGIYLAGGQTPGAAHSEKSGLRGSTGQLGFRRCKSRTKTHLPHAAMPPVANRHGSASCGRGDLNSHVLSDNRF